MHSTLGREQSQRDIFQSTIFDFFFHIRLNPILQVIQSVHF
jgi:hypothetical protein